MANLTTCKTCKEPVASSATKCPHCGEDLHSQLYNAFALCAGIAAIWLGVTMFMSMKSCEDGMREAWQKTEQRP